MSTPAPQNTRRSRPRRRSAPKPKPLSQQAKKALVKDEVHKTGVIPFPPLQASEKVDLKPNDVRHHLPQADMNKLYYKAAKSLASGHGRCSYEPGTRVGDGIVKFTVKVKLSSEQSLKQAGGMANRSAKHTIEESVSLLGAALKDARLETSSDRS